MSSAGIYPKGNHPRQAQTTAAPHGHSGLGEHVQAAGQRPSSPVFASYAARRRRHVVRRADTMPSPGWRETGDLPADPVSAYPGTRGALALVDLDQVDTQPLPSPQQTALCRHILVVEDDSQVASVIHATLELEGEPDWAVQMAAGGKHALELASVTPPDLVLLDVRLPDLDGAQVYHRLRINPATRPARILFLSAGTSFDLFRLGIEDGVLLRKPFDVADLVSLVRAMLKVR